MLLSYEQVEDWRQESPYIRHGYRELSRSIAKSLQSWLYLHNETVNIYTHLLPVFFIIIAGSFAYYTLLSQYPLTAIDDMVVFAFFLVSAATCFSFSVGFHTLENHSKHVCNLALRCDYVGILVLILGDFISGIRMAFFCELNLRIIYWAMVSRSYFPQSVIPSICQLMPLWIISVGLLTAFVLLSKRFEGPKYRGLRLGAFVATGLSAFAPIIHGIIQFGFMQLLRQSGLKYYFIEGGIILLGVFFYGSRIPECFAPGKFDIWGASHQIFHVLIVIATAVHFLGLREAYEYNYSYRQCGLR
jgi:adiponectin receptor